MPTEQAGMLFVFGVLLLVTAVVITGIVWGTQVAKAKSASAQEHEYRQLAEKTSRDAAEIKASLTEIKTRVATIEKLLKDGG